MKLKALTVLEPPGLDRRFVAGETFELPRKLAVQYLQNGWAEAVAVKPSERAEKRPAAQVEQR